MREKRKSIKMIIIDFKQNFSPFRFYLSKIKASFLKDLSLKKKYKLKKKFLAIKSEKMRIYNKF
jgi:hypothetical protein